jgi:uncharacterized membrane protein YeiB
MTDAQGSQAPTGRIDGIDVARAVAILGMVTVHVGPVEPADPGAVAWLYGSFHGKASVLFVLVAGIGTALLAARRPSWMVRWRLVYRTAWLVPLGLLLQSLDHHIAVILQYYGAYFLLLAPLVTLSTRAVLTLAGALLPVGSLLVLAGGVLRPEWMVRLGGEPAGGLAGDLLVFGYYPVVTWLPVMLVGLALGRTDLRAPRTQRWLVLGGAALLAGTTWLARGLQALVGTEALEGTWWWVLSVEAHANMPLAVLGALGFALAGVGLAVPFADRSPRAAWPLAAAGRLALTIYVGHILLFPPTGDLLRADDLASGVRIVTVFALVSTAASVVWLHFAPRGPLEAAARWPWERGVLPAVSRARGRRR